VPVAFERSPVVISNSGDSNSRARASAVGNGKRHDVYRTPEVEMLKEKSRLLLSKSRLGGRILTGCCPNHKFFVQSGKLIVIMLTIYLRIGEQQR
jgi:hypothetical protein